MDGPIETTTHLEPVNFWIDVGIDAEQFTDGRVEHYITFDYGPTDQTMEITEKGFPDDLLGEFGVGVDTARRLAAALTSAADETERLGEKP